VPQAPHIDLVGSEIKLAGRRCDWRSTGRISAWADAGNSVPTKATVPRRHGQHPSQKSEGDGWAAEVLPETSGSVTAPSARTPNTASVRTIKLCAAIQASRDIPCARQNPSRSRPARRKRWLRLRPPKARRWEWFGCLVGVSGWEPRTWRMHSRFIRSR